MKQTRKNYRKRTRSIGANLYLVILPALCLALAAMAQNVPGRSVSTSTMSASATASPATPVSADLPAGRQALHGHLTQEIRRAPIRGKLEDSAQLHLAIGLPFRNSSLLETDLQEIYDPKSPQYRHFLTPREFADQFGPSADDYEALKSFAREHGLTCPRLFPIAICSPSRPPPRQPRRRSTSTWSQGAAPTGACFMPRTANPQSIWTRKSSM